MMKEAAAETPRTDYVLGLGRTNPFGMVPAGFARELEREVARLAPALQVAEAERLAAARAREDWRLLAKELAAALALIEWADTKEMFVTAAPAEGYVEELLERYQALAESKA